MYYFKGKWSYWNMSCVWNIGTLKTLFKFKMLRKITLISIFFIIYSTKGRDRFHWAATPLKPYKVGNIYMTYGYSLLYFLNLSVKHLFFHKKRQFLWKYPNPETVTVPCFNVFAHAQSTYFPIEDTVSASVC